MSHKKTNTKRETFSLLASLNSSGKFMYTYKLTSTIWILLNFVFLKIFTIIPNGWTNSLSILWLIAYYIFWCVFVRYIHQHQPYFSLIRIFNGLVPSSKIMFINILIYLLLIGLPFLPLIMGFGDKYLELFEKYMSFLDLYNGLIGKGIFVLVLLLISPYTIIRPYFAWISSLIGKSRSVIDAYKRTQSNYGKFLLFSIVMSSMLVLSYYIDTILKMHTLIYIMSILMIYFNIVFFKLYRHFYKRR